MTDASLMDADCIHGVTWWECRKCCQQECLTCSGRTRFEADGWVCPDCGAS